MKRGISQVTTDEEGRSPKKARLSHEAVLAVFEKLIALRSGIVDRAEEPDVPVDEQANAEHDMEADGIFDELSGPLFDYITFEDLDFTCFGSGTFLDWIVWRANRGRDQGMLMRILQRFEKDITRDFLKRDVWMEDGKGIIRCLKLIERFILLAGVSAPVDDHIPLPGPLHFILDRWSIKCRDVVEVLHQIESDFEVLSFKKLVQSLVSNATPDDLVTLIELDGNVIDGRLPKLLSAIFPKVKDQMRVEHFLGRPSTLDRASMSQEILTLLFETATLEDFLSCASVCSNWAGGSCELFEMLFEKFKKQIKHEHLYALNSFGTFPLLDFAKLGKIKFFLENVPGFISEDLLMMGSDGYKNLDKCFAIAQRHGFEKEFELLLLNGEISPLLHIQGLNHHLLSTIFPSLILHLCSINDHENAQKITEALRKNEMVIINPIPRLGPPPRLTFMDYIKRISHLGIPEYPRETFSDLISARNDFFIAFDKVKEKKLFDQALFDDALTKAVKVQELGYHHACFELGTYYEDHNEPGFASMAFRHVPTTHEKYKDVYKEKPKLK